MGLVFSGLFSRVSIGLGMGLGFIGFRGLGFLASPRSFCYRVGLFWAS